MVFVLVIMVAFRLQRFMEANLCYSEGNCSGKTSSRTLIARTALLAWYRLIQRRLLEIQSFPALLASQCLMYLTSISSDFVQVVPSGLGRTSVSSFAILFRSTVELQAANFTSKAA